MVWSRSYYEAEEKFRGQEVRGRNREILQLNSFFGAPQEPCCWHILSFRVVAYPVNDRGKLVVSVLFFHLVADWRELFTVIEGFCCSHSANVKRRKHKHILVVANYFHRPIQKISSKVFRIFQGLHVDRLFPSYWLPSKTVRKLFQYKLHEQNDIDSY